ncbi:MAG: nuclear transport factor 2 family protein [Thermoleophilaceae bacterium]
MADNVERLLSGIRQMMATGEPPWDYFADDFVWDMSGDETWLERAEYVGRAGVREFIAEWRETWDDWQMGVDEAMALSEGVTILVMHQSGRVRGSNVPVEMRFAQVWVGEDGMAKRMIMCRDKEHALEEARPYLASRTPTRD